MTRSSAREIAIHIIFSLGFDTRSAREVLDAELTHERFQELGEELLIPSVMLRHEQDKFLDDTTVPWLEKQTGVPVRVVDNDGSQLLDAMTGKRREP